MKTEWPTIRYQSPFQLVHLTFKPAQQDHAGSRVEQSLDALDGGLEVLYRPPVVVAREVLTKAAEAGRITLIMDQTKASDRHKILMPSLRFGNRALPLAWRVEATKGVIGFDCQRGLLAAIVPWLPPEVDLCLMADRFYGTLDLVALAAAQGWGYRLRQKGDLAVFIDGRKSRLDQHISDKRLICTTSS